MTTTRRISPRTLKRRYLRQGRETGPSGMVATLRNGDALEVIRSLDSDHTRNPLGPRDHPPRDSMNRLSSNPASTPYGVESTGRSSGSAKLLEIVHTGIGDLSAAKIEIRELVSPFRCAIPASEIEYG